MLALEGSLRRLQTDHVDAEMIHFRRYPRESASSPSLSRTRHPRVPAISRFCTTLAHARTICFCEAIEANPGEPVDVAAAGDRLAADLQSVVARASIAVEPMRGWCSEVNPESASQSIARSELATN
jgi:hypothetical protein